MNDLPAGVYHFLESHGEALDSLISRSDQVEVATARWDLHMATAEVSTLVELIDVFFDRRFEKMAKLTQRQVDRLQQMLDKNYPILGVEFRSMTGHMTVAVRVKSYGRDAIRYFYVGSKGQLK